LPQVLLPQLLSSLLLQVPRRVQVLQLQPQALVQAAWQALLL
jgi:hypothetical protein